MPTLGLNDYSPIASAIRGRGAAGQANFSEDFAKLQKKEQQRQNVVGAIGGAIEVAGNVYGLLEQSKMEIGKKKILEANAKTQERIAEARLNGEIGIEEAADGTYSLRVDDSLKQDLEAQMAGLDEDPSFKGFGRVRQQLTTSMTQMQQTALTQAKDEITRQGLADGEAAYQQNLKTAFDLSVNAEDITGLRDTIFNNGMLSPQGKEADWAEIQRPYGLALAEKHALSAASEGGLSAGIASIEGTEFTPDEKVALRASVSQSITAATVAAQDESSQAYEEASKSDAFVADSSIKKISGQYPEWLRPKVEEQLRQKQSEGNWTREIQRYDTVGRWNAKDIESQIADVRRKDNQHFLGDEETRKKVLDLLQTRLAQAEEGGSGASDKFGENYVSATLAKFYKKEINHSEAVKLLSGVMDIAPSKAGPAIEEVIKFESPEYASAFGDVTTYIKGLKMKPEEQAMLMSVVRDSLYQTMIDNPNLKNTDFVQAGKQLVSVVTGKSMDLLRKNLITPGWIASTDDQLGQLQQTLDSSPDLSAALVYTDQQGQIGMNTYARASIAQLHDRQRALVAETLGVPVESVVQTYAQEGAWDVTAQAQFSVKGSEKPFYFKAPNGKLELWQGNVKLSMKSEAKRPKGETAPVSDDFWSAGPQEGF